MKTETLDEIAGVEMIVIKVLVAGVILEESWEYDVSVTTLEVLIVDEVLGTLVVVLK